MVSKICSTSSNLWWFVWKNNKMLLWVYCQRYNFTSNNVYSSVLFFSKHVLQWVHLILWDAKARHWFAGQMSRQKMTTITGIVGFFFTPYNCCSCALYYHLLLIVGMTQHSKTYGLCWNEIKNLESYYLHFAEHISTLILFASILIIFVSCVRMLIAFYIYIFKTQYSKKEHSGPHCV